MVGLTGLSSLTQTHLNDWVAQARLQAQTGRLPDYIPLLAEANPSWVALQVQRLDGTFCMAGDGHCRFALMSVIKPLILLYLLELLGYEKVFSRVGMEPSDQPFHSLAQLRADRNFPRNPMINSGAIALADLLPGHDGKARCQLLCEWLNQNAGSRLALNEGMLFSVRSLRNEANRAIADLLAAAGHIHSIEKTLDTYNHICCLSGTVEDLAKLGVLLAGGSWRGDRGRGGTGGEDRSGREEGRNLDRLSQEPLPPTRHSPSIRNLRTVNALMLTCGLYEASGQYAVRIGLPMKSGVSGALLAVVPGAGAIACYSPAIDGSGNSVAGLFMLEQITQTLNLSVFS
jgi:glutaminase